MTKRVGLVAVVALSLLVLAQCGLVAEPKALESLCAQAKAGSPLKGVLEEAAKAEFIRVRPGGATGKREDQWFDREYVRVGEYLKKTKGTAGDYTVLFAKPAVGYYACIVIHKDGVVQRAWFEDRSS